MLQSCSSVERPNEPCGRPLWRLCWGVEQRGVRESHIKRKVRWL